MTSGGPHLKAEKRMAGGLSQIVKEKKEKEKEKEIKEEKQKKPEFLKHLKEGNYKSLS